MLRPSNPHPCATAQQPAEAKAYDYAKWLRHPKKAEAEEKHNKLHRSEMSVALEYAQYFGAP